MNKFVLDIKKSTSYRSVFVALSMEPAVEQTHAGLVTDCRKSSSVLCGEKDTVTG